MKQQEKMAHCLRILAMDMTYGAQSGHPGMPMGMADVATVLWTEFLRHHPSDPLWINRDRFVLSCGHGSALLYALLHLTGYAAYSTDALKKFRCLHSVTPGHPEHGMGIEATTGPLGQGLANAVGMAIAALKAREQSFMIDHKVYAFVSDGCLMEGISQEAISLAGHHVLDNLIVCYDDNGISIDGNIDLTFSENVPLRFQACGWDVRTVDGHDYDQIRSALQWVQTQKKPTLLCCKTRIGKGASQQEGKASIHGAPLSAQEMSETRALLQWEHTTPFFIPDDLREQWRYKRHDVYHAWQLCMAAHNSSLTLTHEKNTSEKASIRTVMGGIKSEQSTRKTSGMILGALIETHPWWIYGSADLCESTNIPTKHTPFSSKNRAGNLIHYGVREHAMAAIMNGMALYDARYRICGSTFLAFSDYARPAIRLAAMMKLPVIYIMTHDSILLGEDGPTHQPVEHISSLRAVPNLCVFRPCDAVETAECWEACLDLYQTPSVLCLTRQNVPCIRAPETINRIKQGAYVIYGVQEHATVDIWSTGSEVHLAVSVAKKLENQGVVTRVISMPCSFLFDQKPISYQHTFTQSNAIKVVIEAARSWGWEKYVGQDAIMITQETFGTSGPGTEVYKYSGFDSDVVVAKVMAKKP